jgi:hypothetical protein
MSSPSQGEILAGFGGDLDAYTDYHCGLIDEDGSPTDYGDEQGHEGFYGAADDDDDYDDDY